MPVLSVKSLKKVYPGRKPFTAVDGISFELKKGEILGLLGPNGAGKTTTIQMLMSTLKPTEGSIRYFDLDFVTHRSEILQKVAFASTYVSLPWNFTLSQNLEVFGRFYGIPLKNLRKEIDLLLERFGIADKKKMLVSSLSAGQITRLMLVKAFMVHPEVVLLDEPTASLDPDIARDVCDFVLEQRKSRGTSILFTSHNMTEVAEVCDRVLFLQDGKILADDLPHNLARSVSSSKVELVIGDGMKRAVNVAETLGLSYQIDHRTIQIEVEEKQIASLLAQLAEKKVDYSQVAIIQPTLADYFLKIAGRRVK